MPAITIKGLKGISLGMPELAAAITGYVADKSISYSGQQTKQRLEQDTPVITGRLKRSTVFRKDSATHAVVGQFAPYARQVQERRDYWRGAIQVADLWPEYYRALIGQEVGVISRKYANQ